jgi:hypothetical protein
VSDHDDDMAELERRVTAQAASLQDETYDFTPLHGVLETASTISMPSITINVDYLEMLDQFGETNALAMLGRLKDLMQ